MRVDTVRRNLRRTVRRTPLRTTLARTALGIGALALLGSAAACTSDTTSTTADPGQGSTAAPASEGDGGFCGEVGTGFADFSVESVMGDVTDPAAYPARIATYAEVFRTVEPPEQIRPSWQMTGDFLIQVDERLDGVDVQTQEQLEEALRFDGEEAFTTVIQLPGQIETIGLYLQDECGLDLGIAAPALADVCGAVDPAHLDAVFAVVPAGETRNWGGGAVECLWSDGDSEVGASVMPADMLRTDILDNLVAIETVATDGADIVVYDGAVGLLRSSAGRSASTDVGDTGVLVSVTTGDDAADQLKAIALAGLVADAVR